jgi:hypothetical protein
MGGYEGTIYLVALGKQIEEELAFCSLEWDEPQLVENQIDPSPAAIQQGEHPLVARLGERPDQVGRAVEGNLQTAPGCLYVGPPRAHRARNNAVVSFGQKLAGGEFHDLLVGDPF